MGTQHIGSDGLRIVLNKNFMMLGGGRSSAACREICAWMQHTSDLKYALLLIDRSHQTSRWRLRLHSQIHVRHPRLVCLLLHQKASCCAMRKKPPTFGETPLKMGRTACGESVWHALDFDAYRGLSCEDCGGQRLPMQTPPESGELMITVYSPSAFLVARAHDHRLM